MNTKEQNNIEIERSDDKKEVPTSSHPRPKKNIIPFLLTFLIMFVLWVLLSGKFDAFHLSLGIISCSIVA
ncbi:MAG: hypothetical protein JSW15_08960, partial [Deltaproteobacteria bacterium]